MQGIKDSLRVHGHVSLRNPHRWEWKHSQVKGSHLAYRHLNVPVHSGFQSAGHQGNVIGSVQTVREQTGKHITHGIVTECHTFYDRNCISAKAKRKRASLTQFRGHVCG
jgi:hypothetical protein